MSAVDLHLHTDASDGLLSPQQLVARAASEGYATIAITDHDTTAGFEALAGPQPLTVIPAIELTCRVSPGPNGTVHLLGYGVDPDCEALRTVGGANRAAKRAQIATILSTLAKDEGIEIPWDEVAGDRPSDAYVGRHMIAAVLVRRGHSRSRRKAFRRYLRSDRVPGVEVRGAEEAMKAIHASGGVAVLAHPTKLDLKKHLSPLRRLGLDGIEVHRWRCRPEHGARVQRAAETHGLLVGGGSDWHGHHPEPPFGTWRPPAEALQPLLDRLGQAA